MSFLKLNAKIFRNAQIYLDIVLKKYELSSGCFRYLFILENNEGISQNKISKEIGNDKAMSARTICNLIKLGYIYKEKDVNDNRAFHLYLTPKANRVIPKIHEEIEALVALITANIPDEDILITMKSLSKIHCNLQKLNGRGGISNEENN